MARRPRNVSALGDWRIIHRHGRPGASEPIMMVATAARHRAAAFEAAEYLMDWLKSRARSGSARSAPRPGDGSRRRSEDACPLVRADPNIAKPGIAIGKHIGRNQTG